MSSLTFTFVNDAAQEVAQTKSFSAAAEARFLAWLKDGSPYWPVDENGDPLADTNANYAAAYRAWADATMMGTWANVKRFERDRDAAAAAAAVPEITFD